MSTGGGQVGRVRGGRGGNSTTDPEAGTGCNCRSWCEDNPASGSSGKAIGWNRPAQSVAGMSKC